MLTPCWQPCYCPEREMRQRCTQADITYVNQTYLEMVGFGALALFHQPKLVLEHRQRKSFEVAGRFEVKD